jgi:2-polyprenyl-3-methyl-5-hydroxy-6-metoxy-1,4-benzoquinol methylase
MSSQNVFPLDQESTKLFALKGTQGDCGTPQVGNANGLKVRRVMQLIRDFSKQPFDQLRILDLACGEGVYAIEAALHGAEVKALDARTERMHEGEKAGKRLGLANLCFEQADIRNVTINTYGSVDVILLLGILYHLDRRDVFQVLQNIHEMCRQFVIIDTHISLSGTTKIEHNGQSYDGKLVREHADRDSETMRRSRLLASLDNPFSFWFTKESLFRMLKDVGFTSVCECNVPLEPFKPDDRITIIASKGDAVKISTYPWVNAMTEAQIERYLDLQAPRFGASKPAVKQFAKFVTNGVLRLFGAKIRRTKTKE